MHAIDIDKVTLVIRSALENGVSWDELAEYVKAQQDLGNPIASMIHHLKLPEGISKSSPMSPLRPTPTYSRSGDPHPRRR